MTDRKKRGRRSGPETEARILKEATDLFARLGYAEASIREIAIRAAVTMPTIYLYYRDKRALYLAACLAVFRRATAVVIAALETDDPPQQRLYNFLIALARVLIEDPHLTRIFQRELADADKEGLEILDRETHRSVFEAVDSALVEALGGEAPPMTAMSTFALTFGFVQYMQVGAALALPGQGDPAERLARQVLRITLPDIHARLFP